MRATLDSLPLDTIMHGDCLSVLRTLPDASVDAIVTDPPAGIAFMGKGWDRDKGGRDAWVAWLSSVMAECRRIVKPGGHALVWALPRTSHWTGTAIEDAGWEVRDCVYHVFGSGFPKSLDVGKALDKAAGARREVVGRYKGATNIGKGSSNSYIVSDVRAPRTTVDITAPATDAAKQWDGWGTALKPAVEVWWLCRAPLSEPSIAANVLRWGTGALHVEACRVEAPDKTPFPKAGYTRHASDASYGFAGDPKFRTTGIDAHPAGRWPPHLLLSHSIWCTAETCADGCPVAELGAQSGERKASHGGGTRRNGTSLYGIPGDDGGRSEQYYDTGTAARYFPQFRYVAKASRRERNAGLSHMAPMPSARYGRMAGTPEHGAKHDTPEANGHPTVKPLALMRWLIALITPPGGIVLDPFAGSGTTLLAAQQLGMHWLGIEQEAEYVSIARARLGIPALAEEVPA